MLDKQIIDELGGTAALVAAGYKLGQVKQWLWRGIPWPKRAKIAALAERKNVELPPDFLEKRRIPPRSRSKPKKRARAA